MELSVLLPLSVISASQSSAAFADLQDPAVPRFRLGYGGYHRSTGELFATEDVD